MDRFLLTLCPVKWRLAANAPLAFYLVVWLTALIVALPYFFAVSAEYVDDIDPWNQASIEALVSWRVVQNYFFKLRIFFSAYNVQNFSTTNLSRANLASIAVFTSHIYAACARNSILLAAYCPHLRLYFGCVRRFLFITVDLLADWIDNTQTR